MNEISSPSFNAAVEQLSSLPGIGKKTAIRLVLNLLNRSSEEITAFGNAFSSLSQQINYCKQCFTITDNDYCAVCINPNRTSNSICVVENVLDVYAVENTNQFKGKYHVLGGIISPIEGVGPNDIKLNELFARVEKENTEELILALSATMEGDATNFYIFKKTQHLPLKLTTIARGIGIGDELEYTDELTLGRSILNRVPFENTLLMK